jgi:hypothetical protein
MAKTLKRTAAFVALGRALTAGSRGGHGLGARLAALPRMMKATASGEYDGGMRLALMTAATIYVVSPLDFVPEAFLALFGLVDDLVVVTWLAGTVLAETDRFLTWEARRKATIPGTVLS